MTRIAPFSWDYTQQLGTGGTWLTASTGSNTEFGGDVLGEPGALSVVGLRSSVSLSSNLTGVVGDTLTIIATSPLTAQFATPSNTGGASFGSNATRVSASSSVGASANSAREDHRHDGIGTVTASSSNTLDRGTLNLRPGTNVSFALSDSDGSGGFDTLTIAASATGGGGGVTSIAKSGSSALTGAVTLTGGTNVTLTQSGNDISIAASGSGSGADANHPLPLDSYAIDATYGDDFTGASLSGSWTRRNFTSGAESYQVGPKSTYLRVSMASRSAGDGYFRSAPAGDWTFAMAYIPRFYAANGHAWGVAVVDTNGTGVSMCFYDGASPIAPLIYSVTTYSTYGGTYYQPGSSASGANVQVFGAKYFQNERKIWVYLRKSGTTYYMAYSLDGETWSPESGGITWAGTVNRVGMLAGPLATVRTGTGYDSYIDVDWFNKIA